MKYTPVMFSLSAQLASRREVYQYKVSNKMLTCRWLTVVSVVLLCWPPLSQGAQVCPLCQEVDCVEELAEHDCPPGHHLQEKVMFGCCPACVKYLDYAQPCPGLLWLEDTSNEVALVYGEVSEFDDMSHWPDSLVG